MAQIEIEQFQLADDVTADGFLAIEAAYLEWCHAHRKGLRRRTAARNDSGWAIVSWWEGRHVEFDDPSPAGSAWREAIKADSYSRVTYTTLD